MIENAVIIGGVVFVKRKVKSLLKSFVHIQSEDLGVEAKEATLLPVVLIISVSDNFQEFRLNKTVLFF